MKKRLTFNIIVCAVIILTIIIARIAIVPGGSNPEKVLMRFVKAATNGNMKSAFKDSVFMNADRYFESKRKSMGYTEHRFNELLQEEGYKDLNDALQSFDKDNKEWLREDYGADYKITVAVSDERILSYAEARVYANEQRSQLYRRHRVVLVDFIDTDEIAELREYSATVTIAGSAGQDSVSRLYYVARIGDRWFVLRNPLDLYWY
ncbi:MAG: hypothetical protein FWF10_04820 [Clostridiales bacterium]|nr:hypothetical protein [Clostridiales bacterium]